jgi:exodeoxyribonuclease VII large subunit
MSAQPPAGFGVTVFTVGDFTARARALIESGLPLAWVAGEISNFTRAASGHCYFTLKDAQAQVRCVLFRHRAQYVEGTLANGMQVEVRATATLYEPRGDFQLTVEAVRRAGLGALFEAFERLKRRLDAEGLFAPERKRPLPAMPRTVGVVTSPQAAALRDVLTMLRRRMPSVGVILYPTPVQGADAPAKIAAAIDRASARAEVDVLLVVRGGGSIEDLWAFNDEAVARAIVRCSVPVVSGVGHETDVTIADFVADVRAPTPTGAVVAAVPDRVALGRRVMTLGEALTRSVMRSLERRAQRVDAAGLRLRHPGERIANQRERLASLARRLGAAGQRTMERAQWQVTTAGRRLSGAAPRLDLRSQRVDTLDQRVRSALRAQVVSLAERLARCETGLRHLDPSAVLDRGYAIVRDDAGRIVRDGATLKVEDRIAVEFATGDATARVESSRGG